MLKQKPCCLVAGVILCILQVACEGRSEPSTLPTIVAKQENPSSGVPGFVAIGRSEFVIRGQDEASEFRRGLSPGAIQANGDFLIGVHESQLNRRYFLSGFLESSSPSLPPVGLGTRVVSFKLQNSKLFVLNADDRSVEKLDFQTPEIIDVLPVLRSYRGIPMSLVAPGYVVFDPDSALNGLEVVSSPLAAAAGAIGVEAQPFQIQMSYSRDFQSLDDGFRFKKVLTGQSSASSTRDPSGRRNLAMSATVSVTMRDYSESEGFTRMEQIETPFFFSSLPHALPDSGGKTRNFVERWHLFPGMKPIHWEVSPWLARQHEVPGWESFDAMGAISRAVEAWNQAIGYKALSVGWSLEPGAFGRDDRNFILFERGASSGYSYADFRSNPNTGEIRGATVMISGGWQNLGPATTTGSQSVAAFPPPVRLRWSKLAVHTPCTLVERDWARTLLPEQSGAPDQAGAIESVERFITFTVAHELGHALGLRHNFKGSMASVPISVMDYLTANDRERVVPQLPLPYDVQAIKYLSGQSQVLPDGPFCTDEQLWSDADCSTFDSGENPLEYSIAYFLNRGLMAAISSRGSWSDQSLFWFHAGSQALLRYIRSEREEYSLRATSALIAMVGVPVSPQVASDPAKSWVTDQAFIQLLTRLYLHERLPPVVASIDQVFGPPTVDKSRLLLTQQAKAVVENQDGIRSPSSRRRAVDILHKMQTNDGRLALSGSLEKVRAQLDAVEDKEGQRMELEDLVIRIEKSLSPYFE